MPVFWSTYVAGPSLSPSNTPMLPLPLPRGLLWLGAALPRPRKAPMLFVPASNEPMSLAPAPNPMPPVPKAEDTIA